MIRGDDIVEYFIFESNLQFDCSSCGGLCCNLNADLPFLKREIINDDLNIYKDFFYRQDNLYYLKTPKKCWFLEKSFCSLKSKKPLFCKLYPLKIWKLNSEMNFVEFIPCPTTRWNMGFDLKKSFDNIVDEYVREYTVAEHEKAYKIKNDFDSWSRNLINFKINLIKYNKMSKEEANTLLIKLMKQIYFHPFLLNVINEKNIDNINYICSQVIRKYDGKIRNIQNLYILIKNDIVKYILFYYYIPDIADMKISKFSGLEEFYNNIPKFKYYNSLYNDNKIFWKKRDEGLD